VYAIARTFFGKLEKWAEYVLTILPDVLARADKMIK
jgi:hypothetical protein